MLVPIINFFTRNEKYINKKIKRDIIEFINKDKMDFNKPKYKWYGLLNYPNKWIGQHFHFKIFLHKRHCIRCNKCVTNCPYMALSLFKKKRHKKVSSIINR